MFAVILGFISALMIVAVAVLETTDNYHLYFDIVGMIIVIGGTLTAGLITFPFQDIMYVFKVFFTIFSRNSNDAQQKATMILETAVKIRKNKNEMQKIISETNDPFFRDGLQLVFDGFDQDRIIDILSKRIKTQFERENSEINVIRTLSKYPPAMGMVGTVIGLVSMLSGLGQEGAQQKLGASMSVAFLATLYGLLFANFVLTPMSENIALRSYKQIAIRQMIIEGIIMIKEGISPIIMQESLNSFLPPRARVDVVGINKEPSNGKEKK
jgi:chemotaxis protein MotA